jgi:arylformamidase
MLEIIDITVPVRAGMTTWPGLIQTELDPFQRIQEGDPVNVTNCRFCAHVGTHVDAPFHHYAEGATVDQMGLRGLMGKGFVMDLTGVEKSITAADLKPLDQAEPFDILLTKTRNSTEKPTWEGFSGDYIYFERDAADDIVRRGLQGLAVDCLSVERYDTDVMAAHKSLLADSHMTIVEGVDLRGIEPGYYWFACFPLRLVGSDGAPARAVLVRDSTGRFMEAWEQGEPVFR